MERVEDFLAEYDDQQLPEDIADEGSIACIYKHDHTANGGPYGQNH